MSANNCLVLEIESRPGYQVWVLSEQDVDSGYTYWSQQQTSVEEALRTAKDILIEQDIEYGLRLGNLERVDAGNLD